MGCSRCGTRRSNSPITPRAPAGPPWRCEKDCPSSTAAGRAGSVRAIGLGIGINSGPALVGNTGSLQKFKYGPLGHTVNLASRVEGATKHLGVSLLITGSTREQLGDHFATRRLCRARVVGIAGEVELHELHAESASPEWQVAVRVIRAGAGAL